ncbi:MAG TPA: thioredoxin domain-containing protein [Actinomycetota bacterium]|nr:thioredoxin domain-containing protein [Actinomycetota bacterium]
MPNRLASATSPYLLQHADNPVDWYEWGPEALERARAEDRPILLSVGYAACHWCHVMERESFEDEDTAALMNERFVNVKVDREERPDVDAVYMDAVQAMTGQGGWPMTVFLTPEGEPFWAGTYFPKEERHGMPAFTRVLDAVAEAWRDRRDEIRSQGRSIVEAIGRRVRPSDEPLTGEVLDEALDHLRAAFDPDHGGFGGAPKFPQPMTLGFLLRMHLRGAEGALDMATRTLDRMAAGGIRDLLGGGFHRYSVDRTWLVPHFEKMLYDNAQLALAYLHAFQVTGEERHRRVAVETLEYLLRDLRHEGGGFFSSEDADSEGEEGRFYVWSWDELTAEVGGDVARALGAEPEGNWEGSSILHGEGPTEEVRERLLAIRRGRVRPATDDKVLAGWNGLAIRAFAEAGRALGEPRYVEAAEAAAGFVLQEMRREDGRLLRAWREGRTSGPAYAEDHALMAAGLLALYEATLDLRWFEAARELADDLVRLFHDEADGGFFETGSDAEELVLRPKELLDSAVPAAGSVAAEVLQRLTMLTGDATYERAALSALEQVRALMGRAATALGYALSAADLYLSPSREIAIAGDPSDERTQALLREVWRRYLPGAVLAAAEPDDAEAAKAIPLLQDRDRVDGAPAAYVCERFVCRRPVTEPAELAAELD